MLEIENVLRSATARERWKSELAPIGAMLLLLALTLRPYIDLTRGDFALFLQAKSFAELRLDIPIPPGVRELSSDMSVKDGRYYSHYPPGVSLLLVPFYWAGHALDVVTGGRLGENRSEGWSAGRAAYVSMHFANLLFVAVLIWGLRRLCALLGLSRSASLHAIVLVLFAAPIWHQAGHLSTQIPSTMLTLVMTVLAFESRGDSWGKLALSGASGAAAILARPMNVMFVGIVGLYVLLAFHRRLRAAVVFGMPAALGILFTLWFNWAMFGDPWESGYVYGIDYGRPGAIKPVLVDNKSAFTLPFVEGFLGLTVGAISGEPPVGNRVRAMAWPSPMLPWNRVRGILLLMPVVVFGVPGFRRLWREGRKHEAWVLAAELVVPLLVYSKWLFWFANSHTPLPNRYLCEGYPGWLLAVAAYAEHAEGRKHLMVRFTSFWSINVQLLVMVSLYVNYLTGINFVAMETYKVAVFLLVASALLVWIRERNAAGVRATSRSVPRTALRDR